MNKLILLVFLCCFFITGITQVPTITSFSPLSGNTGSTVTITGSGFDATAPNNIVYFGAVKANVFAASATSLSVTVPVGATYQPITVTTNGLTASSVQSFNVTFSNSSSVTANSFPGVAGYGITLNGGSSQRLITSDIDGDGKPDVVVVGAYDSISVLRNTSSGNTISLAEKKSFATSITSFNYSVADYDGDGKPDLACTNYFSNSVSVFRNTSIVGSITFAPKIDFTTGIHPTGIVSGDIDGDGIIDIIISNEDDSSVSVIRNTAVGPNISFAPGVDFRTGKRPRYINLSDLDGDLKPDVIISNYESNNISILRNSSSAGAVSFDPRIDMDVVANPGCINAVDLDGDAKNDIVVTNETSHVISTFLNTCSTGSILFGSRVDHTVIEGNIYPPMPPPAGQANTYPVSIATGDIDGDGKPDLYIGCSTDNIYPAGKKILLLNQSSAGNISFAPRFEFPGGPVTSAVISDLEGDDKPEILAVLPTDFNAALYIYGNRIGVPIEIVLCPPLGNTTLSAGISGASYQWQVSTDSINFTNLVNSSNYIGVNSPSLGLNNLPSSNYGNFYRCVVDGINCDIFKIKFRNVWLSNSYGTWGEWGKWSCNDLPDQYTDVVIAGGQVTINSNVTVNTLTVLPGASVIVSPGYNLIILH